MNVVIADYGIVNLRNICHAFQYVGATVIASADPEVVQLADALVLPGVGSFSKGMEELTIRHLDEAIVECVKRGRPTLGICLGMQLLMSTGTEYGVTAGLGLIAGRVERIPKEKHGGCIRKIPHIGWNSIQKGPNSRVWNDTCLKATRENEDCYFVHSYQAKPFNEASILATTHYDGTDIVAAINENNVTGLQFHPETSGPAGLNILKQFYSS